MKNFDVEKLIAFSIGVGITFLLVLQFGCVSEPAPEPIDWQAKNDSMLKAVSDSLDATDTFTTLPIAAEMEVIDTFKK